MKKKIVELLEILLGNILVAAAFGLIILPLHFVAGGVTGLAVTLHTFLPLPLSVIIYMLNGLLFLLGFLFVGKDFIMKTLLSSLLFPFFLELLSKITILAPLKSDPLLASIIAALSLGLGGGLILRGNGSSGGFDILGVIAHKYFHVPVSLIMYLCDTFVVITQMHDVMTTIYGIVIILCTNLLINRVLSYGTSQSSLIIISPHYEEIRQELLHHQDIGMTFLKAETGYLEKDTKVIMAITPYQKINSIKQAIQAIDPTAFVIIEDVRSVLGKGYTIAKR